MQLFITDYQIKDQNITIENSEMLDQIRKVLRLRIGDKIAVQWIVYSVEWIIDRHDIEIVDRDDKSLTWKIVSTTNYKLSTINSAMAVAMPNKRDKIELIVQKLTEIWLDEIIFRPSERSLLKERNEKKYERLLKISKEAVEQSWWWKIPEIKFTKNIKDELKNKKIVVFDKTDWKTELWNLKSEFWLVGPEWWLTTNDYKQLEGINYQIRSLGETVLRTETAAIVGGWVIKNIYINN
jgi:16S rRNA (uracil1498-N3)-methyltransferase